MRAGPMKYRITLLRPEYSEDSMGSKYVAYVEERTVHAERVKASGNTVEEVGEHFPTFSTQYNIRDAHPVEPGWRVQEIHGYLYTVTAVTPNADRGFNTITCVRVNE